MRQPELGQLNDAVKYALLVVQHHKHGRLTAHSTHTVLLAGVKKVIEHNAMPRATNEEHAAVIEKQSSIPY